ncbi:hypothetical protein [Desulfosarcina cetonica]|uniref:hypothetical protein n=1 Tax=Desulfosarcina cetonica TaxID=90730 RepID=UPI0012EEB562
MSVDIGQNGQHPPQPLVKGACIGRRCTGTGLLIGTSLGDQKIETDSPCAPVSRQVSTSRSSTPTLTWVTTVVTRKAMPAASSICNPRNVSPAMPRCCW